MHIAIYPHETVFDYRKWVLMVFTFHCAFQSETVENDDLVKDFRLILIFFILFLSSTELC